MKLVSKLSLSLLAIPALMACSGGGGGSGAPAAPAAVVPQGVAAVCNPATPNIPCNPALNNGQNPNGGAMGSVDILDPGNGSTIIRSRQFHLLHGYAQENGTDTCYQNPTTGDNTYSQTVPIGGGAQQSEDIILNFDPNGMLTIQVKTPTGRVQSVAPASYTLDASTSSILIQGYQGSVLTLAGAPNPNYLNVESINAYRSSQATDKEIRDQYGMSDKVSSTYGAGAFGAPGAGGLTSTFDPHFRLNQPINGQAIPGQQPYNGQAFPGQQPVPGQPYNAQNPVPGSPGFNGVPQQQAIPQNGINPQGVRGQQTNGPMINPLANGNNGLSMTLPNGIMGQIVVSPINHQHVMEISIPNVTYLGAAALTLPNTVCQSQSSGQFLQLQLH